MSTFVILLGGELHATPRLMSQVAGHRVIAADSGMEHAALLGVTPELWLGDFDSADEALFTIYPDVPREAFPQDKDMTDGELAIAEALRRGAVTVEPTQAAQDAYIEHLRSVAIDNSTYITECTPSYFNYEGQRKESLELNEPYGGGAIDYLDILEKWRQDGSMKGLELREMAKG